MPERLRSKGAGTKRGGPLNLELPCPTVVKVRGIKLLGDSDSTQEQVGQGVTYEGILQAYTIDPDAAVAAAASSNDGSSLNAAAVTREDATQAPRPPPPLAARRSQRSGSEQMRPPSTFGVGPRLTFVGSPYKDADTFLDLSKWKTIEGTACVESSTSHASFLSNTPRFEEAATSVPESDGECFLQRRMRSIQDKMQRQIVHLRRKQTGSNAVGDVPMHSAIQQSIDAIGYTMQTVGKIDAGMRENTAKSSLHVASSLQKGLAKGSVTRQRMLHGRRPNSARQAKRKDFTTFGVGLQRDDSLYLRVVPQSRSEFSTPRHMLSSFRVKKPTRPSSAFSRRNSRLRNKQISKRFNSPRQQYHKFVPATELGFGEQVPTSVSLQDRIIAEKAMRQRRQRAKQQRKQKSRQRPASAMVLLRSRKNQSNNVHVMDTHADQIENAGLRESEIPAFKPTARRRAQHKSKQPSQRGHFSFGKSSTELSGAARCRRPAMSKAKYIKSQAHVYLYDDWMQTYVVPNAGTA